MVKTIFYFGCGVLAAVLAVLLYVFNQKPYPIIAPPFRFKDFDLLRWRRYGDSYKDFQNN